MDDKFLDYLLGSNDEPNAEATEEVTAETPATEVVEAPVETTEEAPTETVAEPTETVAETTAEPAPTPPPANWVPKPALHAARQKAQAEAERAAKLEERIRELEEAQKSQTVEPNLFENPDEFKQHLIDEAKREAEQRFNELREQEQAERTRAELANLTANLQSVMPNYPQEVVNECMDYAASLGDENWARQMLAATDPIAAIREEKNRHAQEAAEWEEYRRDPAAFKARLAAEQSTAVSASVTATANQPHVAATATRSLAGASGAVAPSTNVLTKEELYERMLKNK
ncbi:MULTISPECIES: hypothetical protein [Sphingomonas]|uniref:hypothetical protein n=1 Tax=Sphingomonas TaxID=13687 RepID=UPI001269BF0F|nr:MULTISPECIES: hypothetical protein [Sphingomonas]